MEVKLMKINIIYPNSNRKKIKRTNSYTNSRSKRQLLSIRSKTTNKSKGIGGIDTRGVARRIY